MTWVQQPESKEIKAQKKDYTKGQLIELLAEKGVVMTMSSSKDELWAASVRSGVFS